MPGVPSPHLSGVEYQALSAAHKGPQRAVGMRGAGVQSRCSLHVGPLLWAVGVRRGPVCSVCPVHPPHWFGVECQALNAALKGPQRSDRRDMGGPVCRSAADGAMPPHICWR